MPAPSLYRRHRPRTFAEVVGQEHVVRTLRNAVERGRVHHAYLFVGSRGTGKTSMAKILAACLNCEKGPTVEPDGTCDSCRAIASATSLDVIEMDAASNNSVDDIRDLRESVTYAPVSGRHKVYILDEAHMLSTQAWNAFLKTLEEPPPNTIFVLATTEAQKVLPTVVDRCHRFDFTRPGVLEVATVLERVAGEEGIQVPEAAIRLIARSATGSFRDALGTLEQLATYAGDGTIDLDDVLAVLGVASAELLHQAVEAVAAGNPRAALATAAAVAAAGRDPSQFLRDLEGHVRDLLVVQLVGEVPPEVRLSPDRDDDLAAQAARLTRPEVVRLLDGLAAAQQHVRDGAEGRTQLELALIRAASPDVDVSTRALLARIDRLEARLGDGTPPAPASPPPAPKPGPSAVEPAPPREASPPPPEPVAPGPRHTGDPGPEHADPGPEHMADPGPERTADVAPGPVPVPVPAPPGTAPAGLDSLAALWPAVVDAVRPENAMLAALIEGARPIELAGSDLVVAFPPDADFLKRKAEADEPRRLVAAALSSVAGRPLGLRYELRAPDPGADGGETGPPQVAPEDWVRRIVAEFDAEEITSDDPPKEKDA